MRASCMILRGHGCHWHGSGATLCLAARQTVPGQTVAGPTVVGQTVAVHAHAHAGCGGGEGDSEAT
jgi:hypothetical protein